MSVQMIFITFLLKAMKNCLKVEYLKIVSIFFINLIIELINFNELL